jgi:hypothetical protein
LLSTRTMEWLNQTFSKIKDVRKSSNLAFLRGQSVHEGWPLLPKISRRSHFKALTQESNLFLDFQLKNTIHVGKESSWTTLCRMQHFGLPTRLLDWTESFNVALYFAVREENFDQKDGAVWILNPFDLNEIRTKHYSVKVLGDSEEYDYVNNFCDVDPNDKKKRWEGMGIVSVLSPQINSRLVAQQAVFTLHIDLGLSLEQLQEKDAMSPNGRKYLEKVIIPADIKSELRQMLELSSVNEHSLFPDIEGLSKHLSKKYSE